ncbi:MAG: dihydrodipicolinate synthase family protein [Rhodospirillaceae bacterium]|nr:dihydrodipicolinate synthase family protein [Rhodospirillaceae bacterium]
MTSYPRGVSAAMITLYRDNGDIDGAAMARLGRWLMDRGCSGLLLFGTTGEGPSVSVAEKIATVLVMLDAGIPPHAIIVGAGAPSLYDVVTLVTALGEMGCAALVIPPYFFRAAPREGVLAFMDEVLRRTAKAATPVFLYHFVEMSTVAVDTDMMAALIAAHPGRMQGVKDSSGNLAGVTSWLKFPELAVFAGDDHLARPLIAKGGAGVMTATAGLAPALVKRVVDGADPDGEARLSSLWKDVLLTVPVTEAVKHIFAHVTGDDRWLRMRPPLRPLDPGTAGQTLARFQAADDGAIAAALKALPPVFS